MTHRQSMKGRKQGQHTVLSRAAVHLERILVGEHIDLDPREVARDGRNWTLGAPIVRPVLGAVDQPSVIVADAAETAVVLDLGGRVVCAELLGARPEVIDGVLLVGKDGAVGDEDVVYADALARVGEVEGVVVGGGGVRVGEGVEVPVDLVGQFFTLVCGKPITVARREPEYGV